MKCAQRIRLTRASPLFVVPLLLALLVALPALARAQDEEPASPLSGDFSVTMTREDVPADLLAGPALVGRWVLTFGDDGAFALARQDVGEVVEGTFESGPAALTFTGWSGMVGCEIGVQEGTPATYAWQLTDDQLALTPLDDQCGERLTLLTTRPLGQVDACVALPPADPDPFARVESTGTPVSAPAPASGVAAQEGFGATGEVDLAVDRLLQSAGGCWATADSDRFMMLHSESLRGQIAMMGPSDAFTLELREFMETPLRFTRLGEVRMLDPNHAWAYVEVDLGGTLTPQRVDFVRENGVWRFDSFALFGPPVTGAPIGMSP